MSNSTKKWLRVLAVGWMVGFYSLSFGQPCPPLNPITGPSVVCPGSQVDYSVIDNTPASSYLWELMNGGGTVVGSSTGTTFSVLWQDFNGGPFTIRLTETVVMCFQQNVLDVTVADDIARYPFNCFSEVNIPLDNNCEKLILPQHLLTSGVPDCANTFEISLSLEDNVPVPNPITEAYIGEIITATIRHPESGRSCTSLITLKDGTAPILVCENDTTICNDPLAWDPFNPIFNRPTVTDNCKEDIEAQPLGYEWVKLFNDPIFSDYVIRSWEAFDKYGNRGECSDTLFLRRVIFAQIECPVDTIIPCDAAYFDPDDPLTAGVPTFDGMPIYSEVTYCDFGIEYTDHITYKCPGNYNIYREWIITDLNGPVVSEIICPQVITVIDTSGPIVTFDSEEITLEMHDDVFGINPDSFYKTIYFPTLDYTCLAHGYFPKPDVSDFCSPSDSLIVDLSWSNGHIRYNTSDIDQHLRFENLMMGKHIIAIQVADACHNFTYDTLIAVAQDIKPPYMAVDRHPTVTLGNYAEVTWIDVSVFDEGTWDNCNLYKILGRRVDWDSACGYSNDTSIESPVKDHYNNYWEWIQYDGDSLCLDQIEYGWTDQIPFCCDDACLGEKVVIELIAIDASCNVAKSWVSVVVEDKTAPEIRHRLPDIDISCYAYNNYYRDEIAEGHWEVFGQYESFDRYGDVTKTIIKDHICTDEPGLDGDYHETIFDTIANGIVLDNCGLIILETQKVYFEKCGLGWIEREFIFTGQCNAGKADSTKAIQRINIYNDCPLRETDIIWPSKDTTVYACGLIEIETDGPTLVKSDECREIGIHFKDQIIDELFNADSTCLKILRKWAVIDWCRQTADFHADWIGDQRFHYYEYDQIIYIKNRIGPEFINCDIDSLCIGSQCHATLRVSPSVTDDCTAPEDIKLSWTLYEKTDFGYDFVDANHSDTATVSGLQIGTYKLVWKAIDECNNVTYCTDFFDVLDCVKPSPVCLTSTTVRLWPIDLDQNGQIDTAVGEIWAQELNVSSHDNCQEELTDFRIRWKGTGQIDEHGNLLPPDSLEDKLSLGCVDIGTRMVEMWVVDDWGNADFCDVFLEVIGPIEGCSGELGKVKGVISNIVGAGIGDVEVHISLSDNILASVETNTSGEYSFANFKMDHQMYRLKPSKKDDPIHGISTQDLIAISQHVIKKDEIKTRFGREAADVNGDGWISVADIITLRKLILGKIDTLPVDLAWKFFNVDMQPVSEIQIPQYHDKLDFTGIKVGDLNGDAARPRSGKRNLSNSYFLHYPDIHLKAGEHLIPIIAGEPMEMKGLQMEMTFNQEVLKQMSLVTGQLKISDDDWASYEDKLVVSWINEGNQILEKGDTLFSLSTTSVAENKKLSDYLALSENRLQNEFYPNRDSSIQLKLIARPIQEANPSAAISNFPNPFIDQTEIEIIMGEASEAIITVAGVDGRVYFRHTDRFPSGRSRLKIDRNQLGDPGIYYLRFMSPIGIQKTLKLILLE